MPDNSFWDELAGPPSSPEQGPARRRQQASQARLDHALGLVDQAADAAAKGDHQTLGDLVARMDRMEFDDFEECHPPSFALDVRFSEMVDDLIPDDAGGAFGDTWVDHLVHAADLALPPPTARWIRLVVGSGAACLSIRSANRPRGSPSWIGDPAASCSVKGSRRWPGCGPSPVVQCHRADRGDSSARSTAGGPPILGGSAGGP